MNATLRDKDYLEHILDAIARIRRYLASKEESEFMTDALIQDAVIRNLEVIGEAVTKLSAELKEKHSDIPWSDIAGMRNRLIHGYISVNLLIVWDTAVKVLPGFAARAEEIQRGM